MCEARVEQDSNRRKSKGGEGFGHRKEKQRKRRGHSSSNNKSCTKDSSDTTGQDGFNPYVILCIDIEVDGH